MHLSRKDISSIPVVSGMMWRTGSRLNCAAGATRLVKNPARRTSAGTSLFECLESNTASSLVTVLGTTNEDGIWIGWLERSRGLIASVLGGRKRGIEAVAAQAIHEILTSSPQIGKIRWHLAHDFNAGREELGTPEPA